MGSISQGREHCKQEVIEGTGEVLHDCSVTGRERPWSARKKENMELVELFKLARKMEPEIISDSRLESVSECASYLKFAELKELNKRKLVEANFCRLRLCPMCSWRRSLKLFSQVSKITDAILADKPKVRFLFVTLTVQNVNGEDLKVIIKRMGEAWKYLVQNSKEISASASLRKNLLGYMKAIEVTYNSRRNNFHPHIHCILEVAPAYFKGRSSGGGYINHAEWRQMWKEVMHLDYEPQVNVRAIKDATAKAVAEVAKYPVKLQGLLEIKDKQKAAKALILLKNGIHNCRLITFGGDFREYKRRLELDDVENGDLIHIDGERENLNAVAYTLFRYRADAGLYIC